MDVQESTARIFCIGRNFAGHARELSNEPPDQPMVFMKPPTSLVRPGEPVHFPKHGSDLQHEVEIVVKIGIRGKATTVGEALSFVTAITVGLDLTLRDTQTGLKAKGLSWEVAKAFEQSAPIGDFIPCSEIGDLGDLSFGCAVNGLPRQQGNTRDMIFSIPRLIVELSRIWTLRPGDLIFTGTPSGVGPLRIGDSITATCERAGSFAWDVVE